MKRMHFPQWLYLFFLSVIIGAIALAIFTQSVSTSSSYIVHSNAIYVLPEGETYLVKELENFNVSIFHDPKSVRNYPNLTIAYFHPDSLIESQDYLQTLLESEVALVAINTPLSGLSNLLDINYEEGFEFQDLPERVIVDVNHVTLSAIHLKPNDRWMFQDFADLDELGDLVYQLELNISNRKDKGRVLTPSLNLSRVA